MTASEQLNVAVIGCGSHARSHFGMIAGEPRVHLAAIADVNPERLEDAAAEHHPDRSFTDYREMLETTDLDLIYVVTLPGQLLPIVLSCLERDLHVSVEKSPGMDSNETEIMAEAARKSKGKAMVSFNRRYFPKVLALRRLVQGRGGAVHCSATYNKPLTKLGTPETADRYPDPVICDAIHHVDLLRWLAGATEDTAAIAVEVQSEVQDGGRPGAHRHNAVVRFDTGAFGVLMSHYRVGYRIQRAEVHAEDFSAYLEMTGKLQFDLYEAGPHSDGSLEVTGTGPVEKPLDLNAVGGEGFNETRHLVDCILNDSAPWSTLDDAVHTMRLCEAIRRGHKGPLP